VFPPGFDDAKKSFYHQCLFDRDHLSSQSTAAGTGLALLAQVAEPSGTVHLCKLFRLTCGVQALFDLISDPYERKNLHNPPPYPAFCATEEANLEKILRYNAQQKGWLTCSDAEWPRHNGTPASG